MATDDTHALGYVRVDDDANVSVLLDTMEATAGWEATRRLRAWEREQLSLGDGRRLLDVGCGLGEAALTLAEMARVVRPGGCVSLIDTDWSTFAIDVGDDDLAARVREAMRSERRRPSNIGRRLHDLLNTAGFDVLARAEATQTWDAWDPSDSPAPLGCFSMKSLADDLVSAGQLAPADRDRFVSTVHDAARCGHFSMALTMYAVVGVAPAAVAPE